jgi:hypothetical protein
MDRRPGQVRAARAAGCTFIAATENQLARLTLRRRIFRIDRVPHRAGSGVYEAEAARPTPG